MGFYGGWMLVLWDLMGSKMVVEWDLMGLTVIGFTRNGTRLQKNYRKTIGNTFFAG